MMDELTIWLALTGAPTSDAPRMTMPDESWEANEWIGRTR